MDQDEYRELITIVETWLGELGLASLADRTAYLVEDGGVDEPRLPRPQDHLVAILEAFERHLASHDGHVVHLALDSINDELDGTKIEGVRFDPIAQDVTRDSHSLGALPDLGDLRRQVTKLIHEIREDLSPDPGPRLTS